MSKLRSFLKSSAVVHYVVLFEGIGGDEAKKKAVESLFRLRHKTNEGCLKNFFHLFMGKNVRIFNYVIELCDFPKFNVVHCIVLFEGISGDEMRKKP